MNDRPKLKKNSAWLPGDFDPDSENKPFPLLRPVPRESLSSVVMVILGGLALWLLSRRGSQTALLIGGTVAAFLILAGLARLLRRDHSHALFLAGQFLLILSATADIQNAPLALSAVTSTAGGIMLWGLFGMARKADELERRVLRAALAVAFGIASCAMLLYSFLEQMGLRHLPTIVWFEVLVLALYVGLWVAGNRYSE